MPLYGYQKKALDFLYLMDQGTGKTISENDMRDDAEAVNSFGMISGNFDDTDDTLEDINHTLEVHGTL